MTITVTAFLLVLIAGIIAIIVNVAREGSQSSTFWFLVAFWICCLAHLYPGVAVLAVH